MTNPQAAGMMAEGGWAGNLSPPSTSDAARMSELGVRFDGRFYRYKEYQYDLLADALDYAKLDLARSNAQSVPNTAPLWTSPETPTEEQQGMMKQFGVTFDGKHYRFGEYRYDRLADAVGYARLEKYREGTPDWNPSDPGGRSH